MFLAEVVNEASVFDRGRNNELEPAVLIDDGEMRGLPEVGGEKAGFEGDSVVDMSEL